MHGFSVKVFILLICVYREDATAQACSFTDFQVLKMCHSGAISGKGVYLDTSDFTGISESCTCTIESSAAGGSVTFDPVNIDQSNCQTTLSMDAFSYVHDCTSMGPGNGFLPGNTAINMTLEGQGKAKNCMKIYTQAAEMILNITCYESTQLPTTATTTTSTSAASTDLPSETNITGTSCPTNQLPVLSMCTEGRVEGQRLYLDSSLFTDQLSSCSCTVRVVSQTGGTVTIYPNNVDSSNCNTVIDVEAFSYRIDCHTLNSGTQFVNASESVELKMRGSGAAKFCVLIQTNTPGASLHITCSKGIIFNVPEISTTTVTAEVTTKPIVTTEETHASRVCPSNTLPVLSMCTEGSIEGQRLYLDSSFFTDQLSSCNCTVRVVSQAGGTVEIYPWHIDTSNCDTSIYFDDLSYHIGCDTYTHAKQFMHSQDSLVFEIRGIGTAQYCILVQSKVQELRLQLNCSEGIVRTTTESTTTSTSSTTTASTTTTTTTTSTTTTTTTPSTTTTTTKIISTTTTDVPSSTTLVTTEETAPSTTTSTTVSVDMTTSDSAETTSITDSSTADITSSQLTSTIPTTSRTSDTITTVTTDSTSVADTVIVTDAGGPGSYKFPVVGVAVGVSVGLVAVILVAVLASCYRRHQHEKKVVIEDQKPALYGYPSPGPDMLEVGSVAVENPIYMDDDMESQSGFQPSTGTPTGEHDNEHSLTYQPDFESPTAMLTYDQGDPQDISALYATVNKQRVISEDDQGTVTYAAVDRSENGSSIVPYLEKHNGMIRL